MDIGFEQNDVLLGYWFVVDESKQDFHQMVFTLMKKASGERLFAYDILRLDGTKRWYAPILPGNDEEAFAKVDQCVNELVAGRCGRGRARLVLRLVDVGPEQWFEALMATPGIMVTTKTTEQV